MQTKSVTGVAGGDNECFCWFVSKEEYIRIKGVEDYKMEIDYYRDSYSARNIEGEIDADLLVWKIYPHDLVSDTNSSLIKKYTITEEDIV